MAVPLLVKLRVIAVVLVSASLFWLVGWPMVCSDNPADPLTLTRTNSAGSLLVVAGGLGLICIFVGLGICGRHALHIVPVALPAGMTAWALRSPGITEILLRESSAAAKQTYFERFAAEGLVWTVLIALGYAIAHYLSRWLYTNSPEFSYDVDAAEAQGKKIAKWQTIRWQHGIVSLLVSCAAAWVLLQFMVRAGSTHLGGQVVLGQPLKGQIVFAVFISFFLGTLLSHQLFKGRVYDFLFSPLVVSCVFYLGAYRSAEVKTVLAGGTVLFPAGLMGAEVMPLSFIGLGTMGLLWGYWYSVQLLEARQTMRLI